MLKIMFSPEEKELFSGLYFSFVTSDRTARNVEELPIVVRILNGLESVSNPVSESRMRVLKDEGGEIVLEEADRNYLRSAIVPPNGKWTNAGVPVLVKLLDKLDTKEEKK